MSNESTDRGTPRVPGYVTVVVLLLAVGGAGWLVYRMVFGSTITPDVVTLDGNFPDRQGRQQQQRQQPRQKDYVAARETSTFAAVGTMHLIMPNDPKQPVNLHSHAAEDLLNGRQRYMLEAVDRIRLSVARGRPLVKLTAEQAEKIKGISAEGTRGEVVLAVSDADRVRLGQLVAAWKSAAAGNAKAAAEQAVLTAMREIGLKAEVAVKENLTKNATAAASLLTPEQWQQYQTALRAPKQTAGATTKPANAMTRPTG